jgi:hypothetical protein
MLPLIRGGAPADVICLLELAVIVAPDVTFIGTSIDQLAGHIGSPFHPLKRVSPGRFQCRMADSEAAAMGV